ncbi:hypothetical protein ACF064_01650 [Streptomyces sp. NPDC015492]|uniref:hypothetical protein n=1 Tax=Streptomyces sp. NPDC015492 TaxID=3364958 RepID=UPI0036F5BD37
MATRHAIAQALYGLAHLDACVIRATHAAIADRASLIAGRKISAASVEKYLREFRRRFLLVTLEGGLSPEAHKARNRDAKGGRVPLYALVVPASLDADLPTRTPRAKGLTLEAKAAARGARLRAALGLPSSETAGQRRPESSSTGDGRDRTDRLEGFATARPVDELSGPNLSSVGREVGSPRPSGRGQATGSGRRAPHARRGETKPSKITKSRAGQLADAFAAFPVLRTISSERRARLLRPFARAGWAPRDIRHALDWKPTGEEHRNTADVRHPLSWSRYRLGLWLDSEGAPLASVSQRSCPGWQWPGPGVDPRFGRPQAAARLASARTIDEHQDQAAEAAVPQADALASIRATLGNRRHPAPRRETRPLDALLHSRGIAPADLFDTRRQADDAAQVARHIELHGLDAPQLLSAGDDGDHTPYTPAPVFLGYADQTDAEQLIGGLAADAHPGRAWHAATGGAL